MKQSGGTRGNKSSVATPIVAREVELLRATKIGDVGDPGFEGLVARLLQAVMEEPFRVARGGSQRGRDAESNSIFVECKYYDPNRSLVLGDVNQKITEAARDFPGVDLWVLVTSTIVDAALAGSVRVKGEEAGIGTLILDGDSTSPFSLPALLAASPTTVREHFEHFHVGVDVSALMALIDHRANLPHADARREQLKRTLFAGYLGQAHVRERCAVFYSALIDSRTRFFEKYGQHVSREALTARFVKRHALDQALDSWRAGLPRPAVVIGNEGVGKTTAVLEWFLRQMPNPSAAAYLFCTANRIDASDPHSAAAQILSDVFPQTTAQVWRARLTRWRDSAHAPIVLVVDGLNERPDAFWPEWIAAADSTGQRSSVALLVTCWPEYWERRIRPNLPISVNTLDSDGLLVEKIDLDTFDVREREDLLQRWGRVLDDFPEEVRKTLFHPRLGAILCRRYDLLLMAGDFTTSRILFESYRERASHNSRAPLSAHHFNRLIRELVAGQQPGRLLDRELRPIVRDLFGADEVEAIVTEVLYSGVFSTSSVADGSMILDENKARYGLGLVLYGDCRNTAGDAEELAEWLVQRLREDADLPIQSEVVASALFHATRENSEARVVVALVFALLHFRNFLMDDVLTTFVGTLLCGRPETIGDLVELLFRKGSSPGINEWVASQLVECRANDACCPAVNARLERWLSLVHDSALWPFRDGREEQREKVRARLSELSAISLLPKPPPAAQLPLADTADMMRLGRFALYVVSAGPRASLLHGIVCWAVSRTVMGGLIEQDEVQWVLRLTDEHLEAPSIDAAKAWTATNTQLGVGVARLILGLLGTKAAADEGSTLPPVRKGEAQLAHERDLSENPCLYKTPWSDDACLDCLTKTSTSLRLAKAGLRERLFDPSLVLPAHLVDEAVTYAASIDPAAHFTGMGRSIADHALEEDASPFLIVGAPEGFADVVHRLVSSLPTREELALRQLAIRLPDFSPLFDAADIALLHERLKTLWTRIEWNVDADQIPEDLQLVETQLVEALLPHLAAREQLDVLLSRPRRSWNVLAWDTMFRRLAQVDEDEAIRQLLEEVDSKKQETLLWFIARSGLSIPTELAGQIVDWTQTEVVGLRHAAYYFVHCVQSDYLDELVGHRMLLGDPPPTETTSAAQYASYVLARSGNFALERIEPYLVPGLISHIVEQRGLTSDDLVWLTEWLDWRLFAEVSASSDSLDVRVKWPGQGHEVSLFDIVPSKRPPSVRSAFASWREGDDAAVFREAAEGTEEASRRRQEAIDKVLAVWKTTGGQLHDWPISAETLAALFRFDETLAKRWAEWLLADRHFPGASRWRSLESTVLAIVLALWRSTPTLAARLWERMWNEDVGRDELVEHAFIAADGPEANFCRRIALDACDGDDRLFNVALLAEQRGRTGWLIHAIEEGLASPELWRRARSLALAAFSSADERTFDSYVARAGIASTWVATCVPGLRRTLQCDRWARAWYETAIASEDVTRVWAALAAMTRIIDPRWKLWRLPNADETHRVRSARLAHADDMKRRMETLRKERAATLYSLKKEQDELSYVPHIDGAR